MDKNITCCFTGHRELPRGRMSELFEKTTLAIELLYEYGYRNFICGGAVGFDQLAADAVTEFKQEHPDAKLYLFLPCEDQDKYYEESQRYEYNYTKKVADVIKILHPTYTKGCMHERNRMMVDNSSLCVAFVTKDTGGSAYTRNYAIKKGLKILDIDERK